MSFTTQQMGIMMVGVAARVAADRDIEIARINAQGRRAGSLQDNGDETSALHHAQQEVLRLRDVNEQLSIEKARLEVQMQYEQEGRAQAQEKHEVANQELRQLTSANARLEALLQCDQQDHERTRQEFGAQVDKLTIELKLRLEKLMQAEQSQERTNQELRELTMQRAHLEAQLSERSQQLCQTDNERVSLRGELSEMMHSVVQQLGQVFSPNAAACSLGHHSSPSMGSRVQAGVSDDADGSITKVVDGSPLAEVGSLAITPLGCGMGSESASEESAMSWISVKPHCFMTNALFRTTSGHAEFFVSGDQLVKGSQVLADDGQTILEVARNPEQFAVHKVFELHAGDASLFVTPDHRVPVVRSNAEQPSDVQAQDLQPGDRVFVNGSLTNLTSVKELVLPQAQRVLKIAFQPDMAVAVFTPPPAISSKGDMVKRIRRGGMNKRGKPGTAAHEHLSIPDTAPGPYME